MHVEEHKLIDAQKAATLEHQAGVCINQVERGLEEQRQTITQRASALASAWV